MWVTAMFCKVIVCSVYCSDYSWDALFLPLEKDTRLFLTPKMSEKSLLENINCTCSPFMSGALCVNHSIKQRLSWANQV